MGAYCSFWSVLCWKVSLEQYTMYGSKCWVAYLFTISLMSLITGCFWWRVSRSSKNLRNIRYISLYVVIICQVLQTISNLIPHLKIKKLNYQYSGNAFDYFFRQLGCVNSALWLEPDHQGAQKPHVTLCCSLYVLLFEETLQHFKIKRYKWKACILSIIFWTVTRCHSLLWCHFWWFGDFNYILTTIIEHVSGFYFWNLVSLVWEKLISPTAGQL